MEVLHQERSRPTALRVHRAALDVDAPPDDAASDGYAERVTVHTLLHRLETARFNWTRCDWIDVRAAGKELSRSGGPYFASVRGYDFPLRILKTVSGTGSSPPRRRLPFDDASCDVLSVNDVFGRLDSESRRSLLREARRVLRPEGLLAVFESNRLHPRTWLHGWRSAAALAPRSLVALLRDTGLGSCAVWYFQLGSLLTDCFGAVWERRLLRLPFGRRYAVFGIRNDIADDGYARSRSA